MTANFQHKTCWLQRTFMTIRDDFEMAQELEMCFGLLLLGEVPEDRKPGVPRIV